MNNLRTRIMLTAALVAAGIRIGPEVEGVPGRKVDPMKPNVTQNLAEAKRARKAARRAVEAAKREAARK
jgi:hypothetical protein